MGVLYEALDNVPMNNDVIPESCLSFYEQAMYVVDFALQEDANFRDRFGCAELAMYKDHGILVEYVGEDAAILEGAVKDKAVKMFGAMKSLFSRVDQYFVAATKNGEKIVAGITPEALNNCPENLGKTHAFFDFSKIKFADNALKFSKKVNNIFKNKKNISREEALEIDKELSKTIFKDIVSIEASSIKEMKNKLKAELMGSEVDVNKAWVKKNFNRMKDLVAGEKIPSEVKGSINEQKKLMDDMFTMCYSHDGEAEYTNTFLGWEDALAGAVQISFAAYAVVFDVYKRMYREYMNILFKVSKAGKKAVKEAVVADSDVENKDLVDQADPKEKLVPDSVVEEDAYTDKMQANLAKMKEMQAKADEANKKAGDALDSANSKFGIKREDAEEAPDVSTVEEKCDKDIDDDKAAREGKVCSDKAEESQSKSLTEAPDVSTAASSRGKSDPKPVNECDDVNDINARSGEMSEPPAEESEGRPVSEAPDVSTVEEATYTKQHTMINSLFDY